ncbi:MAG: sugar transferase [Bacteroidia bacterium]|nr:sugar transferase [Bacteroidia bacterium]
MSYRLRDIMLSLLAFALLGWLFGLIMLALWLSQGKVFFVQERTGKGGKPFKMIKFSTLRDILPDEREEDNQRFRLTPVGRLLRRFSLDEFPQLIHVLKGEMSLVGPRPLLHDYLPLYSEEARQRFEVLPGITGWAQVKGRNSLTFNERFALDVWYVHHKSFGLDLKILVLTLGAAFRGSGVFADGENTSPRFDGKN